METKKCEFLPFILALNLKIQDVKIEMSVTKNSNISKSK